jgi:hypothetical protein
MIPQASVSITNIDDVESHISRCEGACGNQYLEAIDIPVAERAEYSEGASFVRVALTELQPRNAVLSMKPAS